MRAIWNYKVLALGIILGVVLLLVVGPKSEGWTCYTSDGGPFHTESFPAGDVIVSDSGDRYSSENVVACW